MSLLYVVCIFHFYISVLFYRLFSHFFGWKKGEIIDNKCFKDIAYVKISWANDPSGNILRYANIIDDLLGLLFSSQSSAYHSQ